MKANDDRLCGAIARKGGICSNTLSFIVIVFELVVTAIHFR
jgi:hypothetical protein